MGSLKSFSSEDGIWRPILPFAGFDRVAQEGKNHLLNVESYVRTGEDFLEIGDVPIEFRITQIKQYLPYLRASEQMLFTPHQQIQQALGTSPAKRRAYA